MYHITQVQFSEAVSWFEETFPNKKLHHIDLRPETTYYFNNPHSVEVFKYYWGQNSFTMNDPFYSQFIESKNK